MNTIFEHRTIRKYKNTPVEDKVLNKVLEAAFRASTTGNMQLYSIIVSKDEQIKNRLWELHFKQNMVLQAPVILTFCADFNRFNKWCRQREAEPGYDNFLSFFNASIDAILASQNAVLEAEANGLGICYLGTTTYTTDKIIECLKCPEGVVPVVSIVLGYPDENPGLTDRLPFEAIVHNEVYRDYTPENIDKYYKEKETSAETAELLKINNLPNLAQIFTNKRYTKKDNEHFSEQFLNTIKNQGFLKK